MGWTLHFCWQYKQGIDEKKISRVKASVLAKGNSLLFTEFIWAPNRSATFSSARRIAIPVNTVSLFILQVIAHNGGRRAAAIYGLHIHNAVWLCVKSRCFHTEDCWESQSKRIGSNRRLNQLSQLFSRASTFHHPLFLSVFSFSFTSVSHLRPRPIPFHLLSCADAHWRPWVTRPGTAGRCAAQRGRLPYVKNRAGVYHSLFRSLLSLR